jgi:hypothetical protein
LWALINQGVVGMEKQFFYTNGVTVSCSNHDVVLSMRWSTPVLDESKVPCGDEVSKLLDVTMSKEMFIDFAAVVDELVKKITSATQE